MDRRGENGALPNSDDLRETIILLRILEDRQGRLERALTKLDEQINTEGGINERLAETRIISAERYKNALRRQNCGYVVASALIIGIITWVTVQFGQMRDRDLLRQQLANPQTQAPLPSTLKP